MRARALAALGFASVALGLVVVLGCAREKPPSLRYVVRPEPEAGRVTVKVELHAKPGREISFLQTLDFAGAPSSRYVQDLVVTGSRGKALEIDREPGRFRTVVPSDGAVTIAYAIDQHGLAADSAATISGVLDASRALLFGGQLFVLPAPESYTPMPVDVAIEAPQGWAIATSWGVERATFHLDADSLDVLTDAVIAAGDYQWAARRTEAFNLVVAWREHPEADAESLAALCGTLTSRYTESLGTTPGSLGLVVFDGPLHPDAAPATVRPAPPGDSPPAVLLSVANALVVAGPPGAAAPEDTTFRHLVAHELFHWWCGSNGVLAYRDDALLAMSEGFADYAAARALTATGLWPEGALERYVAHRAESWRAAEDGDVSLTDLSWRFAAGGYAVARAKACLVAYATDRLLERWSDGKHGLRDVYRALVARHRFRPGRALFGPRDYASALAAAAGTPDRARRLEALESDGLAAELDTLLAAR
jgi:predicted metalloprotease with PDZ domain